MDFTNILRLFFALAIVLGLILALAYGLRRYAPNLLARVSSPGARKRLQVVETLVLDPTRRVVLVRVDDQERLILLGEGRELAEPLPQVETEPTARTSEPPPRPRPVAVPSGPQSGPSQIRAAQTRTAQAPVTPQAPTSQAPTPQVRAKLTAASAAYAQHPPVKDPNDDLF